MRWRGAAAWRGASERPIERAMKTADFDFDLPPSLIATRPARPRTSARLLLAEGAGIQDRRVSDLPDILRTGDVLVLNDTKVIPARLTGTRTRQTHCGQAASSAAVRKARRVCGCTREIPVGR